MSNWVKTPDAERQRVISLIVEASEAHSLSAAKINVLLVEAQTALRKATENRASYKQDCAKKVSGLARSLEDAVTQAEACDCAAQALRDLSIQVAVEACPKTQPSVRHPPGIMGGG